MIIIYMLQELNKNKVKEVVRVCSPTYDAHRLEDLGIQVNVSHITFTHVILFGHGVILNASGVGLHSSYGIKLIF